MSPWRRVGLVRAWSLSVLCGLWALLRLSGLEPPWPLSALLAFTPWVIVPALAAVALTAPRALGSAHRRDGVEPLAVGSALWRRAVSSR